ncbi:MAG: hypothetical protein HC895_22540 [Leptolyngbyaceae cyanobacterium SM1_3_5]|nr:hypothetical protein [Leptolyngbyaceae cyanobacterium SM1_3_5]
MTGGLEIASQVLCLQARSKLSTQPSLVRLAPIHQRFLTINRIFRSPNRSAID